MGWKLVRDGNEAWCRAHGVSGQWRTSPEPVRALARKVFEEAVEYALEQERPDPAELYDLLDVVEALISLEDPEREHAARHAVKVAEMGGFAGFTEWCPVPEAAPPVAAELDPPEVDGQLPILGMAP